MNCPYCGATDCPGALGCECRTVRPFLSEREFIARLTEAGWTQAQAEQEYQSIQEEHEGCE